MFPIPSKVRALSLTKLAFSVLTGMGLLAAVPATSLGQFQPRDVPSKSSSKFLAAFGAPVARAGQSTVRVFCDGKRVALGTVVGSDGWILTKASELSGTPVCYLSDDRQLQARVAGVHEAFDLALLKVDATGLKPVEWLDSKNASVGSWLVSSSSGAEALAAGVVSVATRKLTLHEAGPTKAPPGGFLGINMEPSDPGPRISRLQPESPASRAGLKADDCILAVDGKTTDKPEAVQQTLQHHKPGDTIRLKVKRGDKELELQAKLDKRPIAGSGDFSSTLGGKLSSRRTGFTSVLQHDTILRPEDCGGPVVDLEGKVVGINIARAARVETLAIPAEAIQSVLPDLMSGQLAPDGSRKTLAAQNSSPEELTAKPKVVKQQTEAKTAQEKTGTDAKKTGGK